MKWRINRKRTGMKSNISKGREMITNLWFRQFLVKASQIQLLTSTATATARSTTTAACFGSLRFNAATLQIVRFTKNLITAHNYTITCFCYNTILGIITSLPLLCDLPKFYKLQIFITITFLLLILISYKRQMWSLIRRLLVRFFQIWWYYNISKHVAFKMETSVVICGSSLYKQCYYSKFWLICSPAVHNILQSSLRTAKFVLMLHVHTAQWSCKLIGYELQMPFWMIQCVSLDKAYSIV